MSETHEGIRASVRGRFATIASTPEQEEKFPVGPESAKNLGYDSEAVDRLPASVSESFAGVGSPLCLGEIRPGETVLDLGSGAGLDSILAAARVGASGRVFGVDLTEEMVEKARDNATDLGVRNIEFLCGEIEDIPLKDGVAHVAISNGVFNLCPDKPRALAETARVLRPGGRLLMADILLEDHVSPEEVARLGTWSDWIAGAVRERSFLKMLEEAGFAEPRSHGRTGYRTSSFTYGVHMTARKLSARL